MSESVIRPSLNPSAVPASADASAHASAHVSTHVSAHASAKPIKQPLARSVTGAAGLTGGWRLQRPVLDPARCNGCLLCWILCPDSVIAKDTRAIDYDYCKGCGICAKECPRQAIAMVKESDYEQNS